MTSGFRLFHLFRRSGGRRPPVVLTLGGRGAGLHPQPILSRTFTRCSSLAASKAGLRRQTDRLAARIPDRSLPLNHAGGQIRNGFFHDCMRIQGTDSPTFMMPSPGWPLLAFALQSAVWSFCSLLSAGEKVPCFPCRFVVPVRTTARTPVG